MMRMSRGAIFAFAAALALAATASSARAETTREACERTSPDNASLRRCMAEKTTSETSSLEGKACSARRCLIKMACREVGKNTLCGGSGFTVQFEPIETGTEIRITDDKGRITMMSRCGTCNDLDYDSGPLKDADIRYASGFIILDISK
jgi:hypothetical protein